MPPPSWRDDQELKPDFLQLTIALAPDYDGDVTATLVRHRTLLPATKPAILYLHGFIDYFFQRHVAERFSSAGHNFYGLDLRKYGRSLSGAVHPNVCLAFQEYFEEITKALEIIASEGHTSAVLMAHSTGALPAALYAKDGENRQFITRLVFNSPFLEMPRVFARPTIASTSGTPRVFTRITKASGRSIPRSSRSRAFLPTSAGCGPS